MIRRLLVLLAVVLGTQTALSAFASRAEGQLYFQFTDLGTLGGNASFALALNDRGDVTGNSRTGNTTLPLLATLWKDGTITNLGKLPGSNDFSRGFGINNHGVVVGESDNNFPRAFRWENGVMTDIGTLGGGTAVAHDINDAGLIVGASFNGLATRPFIYNGTMHDLGTIIGTNDSFGRAWDISETGDVVGVSRAFGFTSQATLWKGGLGATPTGLGSLGDGLQYSEAYAVNDLGWVVGRSIVSGSTEEAFLWREGTGMVGLGRMGFNHSRANDINNLGWIVGHVSGFAGFPTINGRAVLWMDGSIYDLNSYIPSDLGWILRSAEAVNERGDIVGYGTYQGQTRAFKLTAVPEPGGLAFALALGLSSLGLAVLRRRGR